VFGWLGFWWCEEGRKQQGGDCSAAALEPRPAAPPTGRRVDEVGLQRGEALREGGEIRLPVEIGVLWVHARRRGALTRGRALRRAAAAGRRGRAGAGGGVGVGLLLQRGRSAARLGQRLLQLREQLRTGVEGGTTAVQGRGQRGLKHPRVARCCRCSRPPAAPHLGGLRIAGVGVEPRLQVLQLLLVQGNRLRQLSGLRVWGCGCGHGAGAGGRAAGGAAQGRGGARGASGRTAARAGARRGAARGRRPTAGARAASAGARRGPPLRAAAGGRRGRET
jgi:hypothetical protein